MLARNTFEGRGAVAADPPRQFTAIGIQELHCGAPFKLALDGDNPLGQQTAALFGYRSHRAFIQGQFPLGLGPGKDPLLTLSSGVSMAQK